LDVGQRCVVLIDTAEQDRELEAWLRGSFLPTLPDTCLVVLASRKRPERAWSVDPGWGALLHLLELRNLSPEESRSLLQLRGVSETQYDAVLAETHGHPLALTLLSEVLAQGAPAAGLPLLRSRDVIPALLECFSAHVPDEAYRIALYAAAHSRVVDESLLGLLVELGRAAELFEWLRELSFSEWTSDGLHLHDLAARALDTDHRQRNPQSYVDLHCKIRERVVRALRSATGLEQYRLARDLCWMHRFSPVMGRFVDWPGSRSHWPDPVRESDHAAIEAAERRFYGDESARTVRKLLELTPKSFLAIRTGSGSLAGYVCSLRSESVDDALAKVDPRIAAAHAHARAHGPLRSGERLCLNSFLDFEAGMRPSAVFAAAAIQSIRSWVDSERTALTFEIVHESLLSVWEPMMNYIEHHYLGSAASVGEETFRMFGHDWRSAPVGPFLDRMLQRELDGSLMDPSATTDQLLVLSQPEFEECVRRALKEFTRVDALSRNPLLRCRVVAEAPEPPHGLVPLQHVISLAADTLSVAGKDEKLYSALQLGYLDPAPSQEAAAELSGVPFSSFRRHLGKAVARVVEWLWQRELGGY
jgi:hypothetical protein